MLVGSINSSDIDEQNYFIGFEAQEGLLSAEEDEISDDEGRGRGHRQARSRRPSRARAGQRRMPGRVGDAQVVAPVQGHLSQLMPQRRGGVRVAPLSPPPPFVCGATVVAQHPPPPPTDAIASPVLPGPPSIAPRRSTPASHSRLLPRPRRGRPSLLTRGTL